MKLIAVELGILGLPQAALNHFRTSLPTKRLDPHSVLLRCNNLPMALLDASSNPNLRKVRGWSHNSTSRLTLNVVSERIWSKQNHSNTFGPRAWRKRSRLNVRDFEELSTVGPASQEEGIPEDEASTSGEYVVVILTSDAA